VFAVFVLREPSAKETALSPSNPDDFTIIGSRRVHLPDPITPQPLVIL
jgi:hypothetical protein